MLLAMDKNPRTFDFLDKPDEKVTFFGFEI